MPKQYLANYSFVMKTTLQEREPGFRTEIKNNIRTIQGWSL